MLPNWTLYMFASQSLLPATVLAGLQKKLTFEIKRINVKLGPWKTGFNLKSGLFGAK